jgi:hypothetical protein
LPSSDPLFPPTQRVPTSAAFVGVPSYVPPRRYYIGLFLELDLSPREAGERGCAAIENDGLANELEDLCFWLRAAMTRQVAGWCRLPIGGQSSDCPRCHILVV